jgi:hypothetical protein
MPATAKGRSQFAVSRLVLADTHGLLRPPLTPAANACCRSDGLPERLRTKTTLGLDADLRMCHWDSTAWSLRFARGTGTGRRRCAGIGDVNAVLVLAEQVR